MTLPTNLWVAEDDCGRVLSVCKEDGLLTMCIGFSGRRIRFLPAHVAVQRFLDEMKRRGDDVATVVTMLDKPAT